MDINTKLSSKKYKTLGDLLKAPIISIILVSSNEKDRIIREYLYEWLYINYYNKKSMLGNLTQIIRNISNKPCYFYIMKECFQNVDILNNKTSTNILNEDCIIFIKRLHTIESSLAGVFLDYLFRRIISEQINTLFYDNRAERECNMNRISISYNDKIFMFDKLPITMNESYTKTKDVLLYKTETILL